MEADVVLRINKRKKEGVLDKENKFFRGFLQTSFGKQLRNCYKEDILSVYLNA